MKENKDYLLTNIIVIFLIILHWFFRWVHAVEVCDSEFRELHFFITAVISLISIAWIVFMQISRLFLNWQPLIIPTLLFISFTVPTALHADFSTYFIDIACVAAISALYMAPRPMFIYIIISQISIAFIYINGFLDNDVYTAISRWAASIFILCSLYILIVRVKAHSKTSSNYSEIFSSVLNTTDDFIVILDSSRRVKHMSGSFVKLFGWEKFPNIAINRPFVDLFHSAELKQIFGKILITENYSNENIRMPNISDSNNYYFSLKFKKLPDDLGYMLHLTDISEVVRAKNDAEKANKAKSTFLANMSHELRTPLNAINGLAELELRKSLPPDTQSNLEKIYNSGEVLLNTINDILDISKIEAGRLDLHSAEYSFTSFIVDTLNMNIIRIGKKPIEVQVDINESIPEKLFGDEMRVRQIFNNLLSNAIKYTFSGSITVKIDADVEDDYVRFLLSVKDTGIGISKENIAKLFNNYSMVDMDSHKNIEGTGLGLSITRQLVNMMDGDIFVESEYGKGSTFTAKFRQEIVDSTPIGAENVKSIRNFNMFNKWEHKMPNLMKLPHVKALIVDDVQVNIDVAAGMLSAYGMQIDSAVSGMEAIHKINGQNIIYDIIFMDHMMPEMDGIETVKYIRTKIGTKYAKTVPIIAFTANAIVGIEKLFLANGFQDYLSKPVDAQKLDDVIKKWVTNKENTVSEEIKSKKEPTAEQNTFKSLFAQNTIAGINFSEALKRFSNSPEIYLRVLRSFAKSIPSTIEKLANPTADTLDAYKIHVHGLKGSFYGIGAKTLGELAEALEKEAGAQNLAAVLQDNDTLIDSAQVLVSDICLLLEQADEISTAQSSANAPDKQHLQELLAAANSYDMDKIEECFAKIEKFIYENDADLVKNLRDAINAFNYDKIIALLT